MSVTESVITSGGLNTTKTKSKQQAVTVCELSQGPGSG